MHAKGVDYRTKIESLGLEAKTKKGAGFAKTKKKEKVHAKNQEA